MIRRSISREVLAIAFLAAAAGAAAQQLIVYPAKGQSPQQQQGDQGECQVWATQNTGIDPVAVAQALTLDQSSGRFSASLTDLGGAFVLFGARTPL